MNAAELDANPMATRRVRHDLNRDPTLPFADAGFDAVLCCVSVDYLTRPVQVLGEAARVLRPGAPVVLTFSNRMFPTKAVHGWRHADEAGRCVIAAVPPPDRRLRCARRVAADAAGVAAPERRPALGGWCRTPDFV